MSAHEFHTSQENRPISSLLSDLGQEVTTLIQQELQLAKVEASEKISQAEAGVRSLALGGAIAFGGFLVFLQGLAYALAGILGYNIPQFWIAFLIIGVITLIVGYGLLKWGQSNLKAKRLALQRTKQSLQRDKDLVKKEVQRSKHDETY
jgi:hypothetical protein